MSRLRRWWNAFVGSYGIFSVWRMSTSTMWAGSEQSETSICVRCEKQKLARLGGKLRCFLLPPHRQLQAFHHLMNNRKQSIIMAKRRLQAVVWQSCYHIPSNKPSWSYFLMATSKTDGTADFKAVGHRSVCYHMCTHVMILSSAKEDQYLTSNVGVQVLVIKTKTPTGIQDTRGRELWDQ